MITEQGHLGMTHQRKALIFNQSLDVLNFTCLVFSPDFLMSISIVVLPRLLGIWNTQWMRWWWKNLLSSSWKRRFEELGNFCLQPNVKLVDEKRHTQTIWEEHSDNLRNEILIRYKKKNSDGNRLPRKAQEPPSLPGQGQGHHHTIGFTLSLSLH